MLFFKKVILLIYKYFHQNPIVMKFKYIIFWSLISVSGILLIACSKEKITENRLTKRDGEWNIDQIEYTYVYEGVDSTIDMQIDIGTVTNAGTVTFTKSTVEFKYDLNLNSYNVQYRYIILNDGTFLINKIENSFFTNLIESILSGETENAYDNFDIDQSIVLYTGELSNRINAEIIGTETRQYVSTSNINIEQEVFTATFTISR